MLFWFRDVGLIMARRLTWEGAKIEAILEIMPYPSGLIRNVLSVQKTMAFLCTSVILCPGSMEQTVGRGASGQGGRERYEAPGN